MVQSVLLSQADRQLEAFALHRDGSDVSDSLFQISLFHDQAVLPDIFFFISESIAKTYNARTRSVYEEALELGLMLPAFRASAKTFESSFEEIESQGILGVRKESKRLAKRLDTAWKAGPRLTRAWSGDSSVRYRDIVARAFRQVTEKQLSGRYKTLSLAQTAATIDKLQLIEELELDDANSERELRRGAAFTGILKKLNLVTHCGVDRFEDISQLIKHPALSDNGMLAAGIPGVVSILNIAYHNALATSLENAYSFVPAHCMSGPVAALLEKSRQPESSASEHFEEQLVESIELETHTFQIRLPPVTQLQALGLSKLYAIRQRHLTGYFTALANWRKGRASNVDLQKALGDYAAEIVKTAGKDCPYVTVQIARLPRPLNFGVTRIAWPMVKHCLRVLSPEGGLAAEVASNVGAITLEWAAPRTISVDHVRPARVAA